MTPSFQERSELKGDGGFSETQDLKSAGSGESNLDSRTNSDPSETNPDEVRIGKENSVTPSFQERSELKGDGGFSETRDLKTAGSGESNLDSRTNSDPSETNPDEVRIGKENSVTPSFQERSELKGDGGFSETRDLKTAGSGESNLDSRTNSDPSETNPEEGRIGKEKGRHYPLRLVLFVNFHCSRKLSGLWLKRFHHNPNSYRDQEFTKPP